MKRLLLVALIVLSGCNAPAAEPDEQAWWQKYVQHEEKGNE